MARFAIVLAVLVAAAVGFVVIKDHQSDGALREEPFVYGLDEAWSESLENARRSVESDTVTWRAAHSVVMSPDARARAETNLDEALHSILNSPPSEDAAIWIGRRLAYLGRYEEAISNYTSGLEHHPDSAKLLRHRGHRYVTVGKLDEAIADLSRADELTRGRPDEIEPDGIPNARNSPTSTLQSNILYHLGLAHFLKGDFAAARDVYERCYTVSLATDDMLVATTHWLTMTLRRVGRTDLAQAALMPIHADLDIIENHAYLDLALMRRGDMTVERALGGPGVEAVAADSNEATPPAPLQPGPLQPGNVEWSTRAFGVAHWKLTHGEQDEARELLERIVAERGWPAFGFLAAQAELARMGDE